MARALETLHHLLLGRADFRVRHHLHHRIEVLQVTLREIGDAGEMIEVDLFRRQGLAREINVVRARAAKATEPAPVTTSADRAKIENVQRTIRSVSGCGVEGDQPSREESKELS